MIARVNVIVDPILDHLFERAGVSENDQTRLEVCETLKGLDFVGLQIISNEESGKLVDHHIYMSTASLREMLDPSSEF
jgi:hypothetical protein